MKLTKIPASRTGIFVIICFSLLVIALFLIGDKSKLFSNTSTYNVKFRDINGLKQGAQVIMSGMNVGSVSAIELPKKSGDSVHVSIHIIKEAQGLIHLDSRATVTTVGLVGDKTIAITDGTSTSPVMPIGGWIIGESPRDLMGIVDTAASALAAVKKLTDLIDNMVTDIRSGKGTVGKFLTDDELYRQIKDIVSNTDNSIVSISNTAKQLGISIDSALGNLASTSSAFKNLANSISSSKGTVGKLLNDTEIYANLLGLAESVKGTVAELHDAMTKISAASGNTVEVTEALKHNFLVKGYFEDRGYWSTSELEKNIQTRIDSLQILEARIDEKLKQSKK
jgi:phospholipid/cholesterol/gamma-HCH transport system substrate-binding protein